MSSSYTTIFFDWGGVVANDPGDEFLGLPLKQIGATDDQVQEILETYMSRFMRGQISEAEYWTELNKHYGFKIHDSISEEFKKWRGLIANQDILDLVKETRNKDLQTAIFSNVIEPTYNVLQQAGYYNQFDKIIASCKVGFAKPQTEIYQLALDQLNTTANRSIFIDDKQANLDPAAEMGFATVLAQNPNQIITDVRLLLA